MAVKGMLEQLFEHLDAGASFKLEAGAGSGKTHSLVRALQHLLATRRTELEQSGRAIACITYANAAKDEIRRRVSDDPLVTVATIHEFLWSVVKPFQAQLRAALIDYNKSSKIPIEGLEDALTGSVEIVYSDRGRRFDEGVITHGEVIELSHRVMSAYPRLCRIVADRYPFIFIDEYQDTFPKTVELLLEHLLPSREKGLVVGLFGDSMQKIYSTGIGPVDNARLRTITKHENYRSSNAVVALLNRIRPELAQSPAGPPRDGEAWLIVADPGTDPTVRLMSAEHLLTERGWSMDTTKRLYLTHRLIAGALGYPHLDQLYDKRWRRGRTDLLEGREPHARLLSQIHVIRQAHEANDAAALLTLLRLGDVKITRHEQKAAISSALKELSVLCRTGSIGEVIDLAHNRGIVDKPREIRAIEGLEARMDLDEREERQLAFAQELRALPFQEFADFAGFRDELTPYSTQHGVKGAEFNDVLVVVDDAAWTQFNMAKMIAGTDKPERATRSRNMFYVCCSRARDRLAVVFLSELPDEALSVAREWFGTECVVNASKPRSLLSCYGTPSG